MSVSSAAKPHQVDDRRFDQEKVARVVHHAVKVEVLRVRVKYG